MRSCAGVVWHRVSSALDPQLSVGARLAREGVFKYAKRFAGKSRSYRWVPNTGAPARQ
jgi:hypothetical protein